MGFKFRQTYCRQGFIAPCSRWWLGRSRSVLACVAGIARAPQGCDAAPGAKLPPETTLRLEQRPVGSALTKPDSPGWGVVGTSENAELHVPLSDFVSGVDVGKATYRVTLRSIDGGPALATSDVFTVTWAR